MTITYLTDEWAAAATTALSNTHEFLAEAGKLPGIIAWTLTGAPNGVTGFWLRCAPDAIEVALGAPPEPARLQLAASHDLVAGLFQGTIAGRDAFMSGGLTSDSKLGAVMKYLGLFHVLNEVVGRLDVAY